MATAMIISMCVLFFLSVPVAVSIGLASLAGIVFFTKIPLIAVAQQFFITLDKFPLAAVPFFILAGNVMGAAGISGRLVAFAKALTGRTQGGLAYTCIVTCMLFAAMSGSGVATTLAIGAIMIPAMVRAHYPVTFASSLQATSAELGVIIPPSIPLILYGVSAEVSIGDLFVSGIVPGILIAGSLMVLVGVWSRLKGFGTIRQDEDVGLYRATREAVLALLMPVIILGGIYGGIFTPTEASAVAVFYALAVGMFAYRTIRLRDLYSLFRKSAQSSTSIMLIIASAGLFSFLITRAGVPARIAVWLSASFETGVMFLLAVNLFLFVVGMFVETSAAILVLAPILVPVAIGFGIDPIHFGIVMVINMALGMITPPVGVNLFAACSIAGISVDRMVTSLVPFVLTIVACLMAVTYMPSLALFLVHWSHQ